MKPARDLIINTIKEKGCLKQNVYRVTLEKINLLKESLLQVETEIAPKILGCNENIEIKYTDKSEFDCQLKFASDILVFHGHSNIFTFEKSHPIWKTSYLQEEESRGFFGMISVYNFLADSFKFNRSNDIGYLIARIFVNAEEHFFVEGKRQLAFLYNDLPADILDKKKMISVVESAMLYSMDFDLQVPPYDSMAQISVDQIIEVEMSSKVATGKRLGFRFQSDNDHFE
jgi:hypothetical protein